MQHIVIAGGGGFGIEIAEYLRQDIERGHLKNAAIRGVIDDTFAQRATPPNFPVPYLGSICDYSPEPGDCIVIAIGSTRGRAAVYEKLHQTGVKFLTYVHSSAYVAKDAQLGEGSIVCANSIINSQAQVGSFAAINVFCSVGHGARVGEFSVLSPYSALNGDASIGKSCFLGTRATVFPKVSIGDHCVVDSHSFVKANVDNKKIISVRANYLVLDNRLI